MVELEELPPEDAGRLKEIVERHAQLTGSHRAALLLADWERYLRSFLKVIPKDYRRVLQALAKAEAAGLSGEEAMEAAFEENLKDTARVGGT